MTRKTPLLTLISLYQLVSRLFLTPTCRFYPSCSEYAKEVLQHHALGQGLYLSIRRILKCHPLNPGGIDFPPVRKDCLC